jgi:hypothetical protein
VRVTLAEHPVAGMVTVKAKAMKDPWCPATNRTDLTAAQVVAMHGRRFTIEETFRDAKNGRYGLGLSTSRVSWPSQNMPTISTRSQRAHGCRPRRDGEVHAVRIQVV